MKLGNVTVTVINTGTTTLDSLGTNTGVPVLTVVKGCALEQHRAERELDNVKDVLVSRLRLFAPAGAPLSGTSSVVEGAVEWPLPDGTPVLIMDGDPAIWRDRGGRVHHIECYLRQQEG